MPMRQVSSLVLLSLVAAAGCGPRPAADGGAAPPDSARAQFSAADIAAVKAADSAFASAASSGNIDGVAAVYAPDAKLLPPNEKIQAGQAAIRKFWGDFLDANRVDLKLSTDQVEGRQDLAYVVGSFTLAGTPKNKGPAFKDEGKFVEVLKRQGDGSWKYVVDMYSSNLPMK